MKKILILISVLLIFALAYVGYEVFMRLQAGPNAPASNNIIDTTIDAMFRTDRNAVTDAADTADPFGNKTTGSNGTSDTSLPTSHKPPDAIETIDLPGVDGKPVRVLPFLPPLATSSATSSAQNIQANANIDITPPNASTTAYRIIYIPSDQSFNIGLLKEPLAQTRLSAEAALQGILGISREDMCRIKQVVITLREVNAFYAGQNLGFSFCPGAVRL